MVLTEVETRFIKMIEDLVEITNNLHNRISILEKELNSNED